MIVLLIAGFLCGAGFAGIVALVLWRRHEFREHTIHVDDGTVGGTISAINIHVHQNDDQGDIAGAIRGCVRRGFATGGIVPNKGRTLN